MIYLLRQLLVGLSWDNRSSIFINYTDGEYKTSEVWLLAFKLNNIAPARLWLM